MRPMSLPIPGHVPSPMPVPNSMNQDVHTRQTIDRLQCIQKHLKNPTSFVRTARELLEWCSDSRAFQSQFIQCLMSCLTVVNDVAGKPGFDLDLCFQLLALCHSHRDKFNSSAAALLGSWLQNIRKLVMMSRHPQMDPMKQNNMTPQGVPGASPMNNNLMNPKMGYSQPHMGQRPHEQNSWNQNPQQPPPSNQHPSLSVITTATVWGVSTTQTPPVPVHSHSSSTAFAQQSMGQSGPHMGGEHIQSNYNNNYANKPNQANSFQNSAMFSQGHRGMSQGRADPQGHPMGNEQAHQPQAAAAAAAAVAAAAAAATATATATATFIKEHQDQNQMNSYDQASGGPMNQNTSDPHMGPSMHPHQQHMGHGPSMHGLHPQPNRGRPQMPPQYGRAASVPSSFPMSSMTSPRPLTHNGSPMYNNDMSYKAPCRPQQTYGQAPYSGSPGVGNHFNKSPDLFNPAGVHRHPSTENPNIPGYNPRLPGSGPSIHPNGPQHPYYPYQQTPADHYPQPGVPRPPFSSHYPNEPRFPNSQPPIPGNPTPPLTPGSAHNVPPYASMASVGLNDAKSGVPGLTTEPRFPPHMSGGGPMHPTGTDDLRLTFPVRDGMVIGPFRLEHNLPLSSLAFHLRQTVYNTLLERPDLDLQFKCYHHDDIMKHTNWPHSVQVSVNNTQLTVPKGANRTAHKPLYLKRVCLPGRNAIDITVSACCCSHFFVLQLVHRPSIRFVLKSLMVKRILSDTSSRNKIKQNFNSGAIAANNTMITNTATNGAIEPSGTAVKVSLDCSITGRRIQIPTRGQECKHIQCFDLESYLQINSENAAWRCPVCHKNALLEILEVDDFMHNILKAMVNRDCHLVSIDANCNWTPLPNTQQHEPMSRPSAMEHVPPNGMIKQEPYSSMSIKQESVSGNSGFAVKQEHFISALQIKQEPHQHRHDIDGPPSKRLKSVTSPGINLNNLPAPSPGSSGGSNKMTGDQGGFPHSYDYSRFGPRSGNQFLRGTSGVAMTAEMSDQIAANDMVPIEKRLNPARVGANSGMMNGSSPKRQPGGSGTPNPHGLGKPMRSGSRSAAIPPQTGGCQNNSVSTPSSMPNSNVSMPSTSSSNQCPPSSMDPGSSGINPTTPIVSLRPNCSSLDQEDGIGMLESFFEDNVTCGDGGATSSLSFEATSEMKTEGESTKDNLPSLSEILPDSDFMEMLPIPDLATAPNNTSNNSTTEEDILSLFDSANS